MIPKNLYTIVMGVFVCIVFYRLLYQINLGFYGLWSFNE